MLKFMRRNASGPWIKMLFLAIAAVFVFWGIGVGIGGDQRVSPVAKVNGVTIAEPEFQRAYANLLRMYQEIYKENFRPELLQGLDLKGKAIDQLVRINLMRQEADRLGLQVSDSEVRDSIAGMASFQQGGRFDKDLYVRILRANNLTPADFEQAKREEILVNKLQDLLATGVHVSEADARLRFDLENEKVALKFVGLKGADLLAQAKVTDEEVQRHFDAHAESFREPDRLRIEFAVYTSEEFIQKVEISNDDVEAYYKANTAEFSRPEQVHARHILLRVDETASDDEKAAVRKKADDLVAKVKGGGDFAELAKKYSEDPGSAPNGGDLGFFPRGQMVPPFEAVAFSLTPGSVSDIVETNFGLHIIKVEAKEEARQQSLDEVRNSLRVKLAAEKAREQARAQATIDRNKLAAGENLESLAKAAGVTAMKPPPFALEEPIEGIGVTPLNQAVFAVQVNETGPVVDVPRGFAIFRVTEKVASHVPELAVIRSKVEQAARAEKAKELAKQNAEKLLAEAKATGFDAAVKTLGVSVEETMGFTRAGSFIPKIGMAADLKQAAFELNNEKPLAPAVYDIEGTYVVAALQERIPAPDTQFEEQKSNLMTQAENQRRNQVLEEFLNYLKARATVELNETYLARISDTAAPVRGRR